MSVGIIFLLGVLVGAVSQRHRFCILGAFVELFATGKARQLAGVLAAMLVFSVVRLHGSADGLAQTGVALLVGGLIQGIGYYLASGCTLGLLVRLGEGSKFHLVVFASFVVGLVGYMAALTYLPVAAPS